MCEIYVFNELLIMVRKSNPFHMSDALLMVFAQYSTVYSVSVQLMDGHEGAEKNEIVTR